MHHRYKFVGDDDDTEIHIDTDTEGAVDTTTVLRSPVPSTRNIDLGRIAASVAHLERKEVDKTMYQVHQGVGGRSTQHWQEAGEIQRDGGSVFATTQRVKHKQAAKAYVVFFGRNPGVYDTWADAKAEIVHQSNAIHQGYSSHEAGLAAFRCAQSVGWTWTTTTPIPNPAPFRLKTRHNIDDLEENTLEPRYYVVTRGRRPGVYASYLQAAIATTGIPGNHWESFHYVETALKEYVKAKQEGRVAKIVH